MWESDGTFTEGQLQSRDIMNTRQKEKGKNIWPAKPYLQIIFNALQYVIYEWRVIFLGPLHQIEHCDSPWPGSKCNA